jgi:hypothetical protein
MRVTCGGVAGIDTIRNPRRKSCDGGRIVGKDPNEAVDDS